LLYRDGLPIALLAAGEVQYLETLDPAGEWEARKALLRARPAPAAIPDGDRDVRAHALLARPARARSRSGAM
jgi:hypothetical protein